MRFEIVTSPADIRRGLSGRAEIPGDYGMLFVYRRMHRPGFWMRGMLAAIDIVWLADNGQILAIDTDVKPETFPNSFYPPSPVRLVLEVRAGEARAQGWTPGVRIALPPEVTA